MSIQIPGAAIRFITTTLVLLIGVLVLVCLFEFIFTKSMLVNLLGQSPALNASMKFFSQAGSAISSLLPYTSGFIISSIFTFSKIKWNLAFILLSAFLAVFIIWFIFHVAGIAPETHSNFSFSSVHAIESIPMVLFLMGFMWKLRWFVFVFGALFVLLVSLSDIYLGMHYSDASLFWLAPFLASATGLAMIFQRHLVFPYLYDRKWD